MRYNKFDSQVNSVQPKILLIKKSSFDNDDEASTLILIFYALQDSSFSFVTSFSLGKP